MGLDVEKLLSPISDESPTGDDLEYDLDFTNLERSAQYTPEKEMAGEVVPEVVPDWRDVRSQAEALFDRTKDLRVAVHLSNSVFALEGFSGLRDGLELIAGLLEAYWETVHPQLDADDDDDPTFRVNAVQELSAEASQHTDACTMLTNVQMQPFVTSRQFGSYNLHDLKVIDGEAQARRGDERPAPLAAHVDTAFLDSDVEEVASTGEVVSACVDSVKHIESLFVEKVGQPLAPELKALGDDLTRIHATIEAQLIKLGGGEPVADDANGQSAGSAGPAGGGGAGVGMAISGDVTSRDDVVRMIDKVMTYYAQAEPSSPVPMLLNRAKSLVHKSFMEIVEDLTPSGVAQAQLFDAPKDETGSSDSRAGAAPAPVAAEPAAAPPPAAPAPSKDDGW